MGHLLCYINKTQYSLIAFFLLFFVEQTNILFNLSKPSCLNFTVVSAASILSACFLSVLGWELAGTAFVHKPDGPTGPLPWTPLGETAKTTLTCRPTRGEKASVKTSHELVQARCRPSSRPTTASARTRSRATTAPAVSWGLLPDRRRAARGGA